VRCAGDDAGESIEAAIAAIVTASGTSATIPTAAAAIVAAMPDRATGTFDVTLTPTDPELGGAVARFDFVKTFHGDLAGTGAGLMLSCGDPASGAAGYVAIETVEGTVNGRAGGFALQQLGQMDQGEPTLRYEVVPGSGSGELHGITGTFDLTIEADGTHRFVLDYEV
jgi:hypothetical protein